MNAEVLAAEVAAADRAALAAAAAAAEEALVCHRAALLALAEGWRSESGCAAIDDLQRQCADATDIVAQLHRAAADLTLLRDGWAGSEDTAAASGDVPAEDAQTAGQPVVPELQPGIPVPEAVEGPAAQPGPAPAVPVGGPWAGQPAGAPGSGQPGGALGTGWGASPATAPPGPNWPTAALPDLGGSLVNLVAHIAQELGSYSEAAEPMPAAEPLGEPSTSEAHPAPAIPDPPPAAAPTSGPPGNAVLEAPVPQPTAAPELPQQLLAAERPADPGMPAPAPPTAGAPPASAPAPSPAEPPPPPVAEPRKPCEIAADELAKVGE